MGLTPSKLSCQRRSRPEVTLNPFGLNHLGDELFCNLCHELEISSLGNLASSSRRFNLQLQAQEAWRQACRSYGAANVQQLRDMLTLKSVEWRNLQAEDDAKYPPARDHHVAFGTSMGLVIFGGNDLTRGHMLSDTWVMDVKAQEWRVAATAGIRPPARTFNADGGGGGILRDAKTEREWMVIYGGLRGEGFRDNETWLLGPMDLDPAEWRWQEIEEGGGAQSRLRPTPRFHHSQTVLGTSTLAVLGGHDFMIRPILAAGLLKLHEVDPEGDEIEWELLSDPRDGPAARAYHSAVHWRNGALVIFGGVTRPGVASSRFGLQVHGDTWILDTETPWRPTWQRLPVDFTGTLDGGRCHATASVLAERFLAIAGGCERVEGVQGDDGWIMAGLQVRPDLWILDLENPQSWQKLLDFDRPAWWDSTSMVVHERTMLIFGGHDSSQVNEFNDPMGGYATKEDALLVRVDRNGALKTSKYCGDEPPREASYSSLVTMGTHVLCCSPDATGDAMQAFKLCWGETEKDLRD